MKTIKRFLAGVLSVVLLCSVAVCSGGLLTTVGASEAQLEVLYSTITYDKNFYNNKASIDKVYIENNKLYINYRMLSYAGQSDSFATDAVFYDANNNILDITQVMYAYKQTTGTTLTDYTSIPKGTATILINSATKTVPYRVSQNHGNTDIDLDIPRVIYDKDGESHAVEILSYNVHSGKLFLTYRIKKLHKMDALGSASISTTLEFRDAQGGFKESTIACYIYTKDSNASGNIYFDYMHIPDGTGLIHLVDNKDISIHSYTGDCDVLCNTCNYQRASLITHSFGANGRSCTRCRSTKLAGDVTGDNKINSLDGLMLLRHLNGWNISISNSDELDVNGDGKNNSLDGLFLMRYLNGWELDLLHPDGTAISGSEANEKEYAPPPDAQLESWSSSQNNLLKSYAETMGDDAIDASTYLMMFSGTPNINFATTINKKIDHIMTYLGFAQSFVQENVDRVYNAPSGETKRLKNEFHQAQVLAAQLASVTITTGTSSQVLEWYNDTLITLMIKLSSIEAIAKNT